MTPLVSVVVPTYQHAKFIRQCLDSILAQKTNFDFDIIVGEDESSDGTREICIEYAQKFPEKIKLFLRSRKDVIFINGRPTGRFNFIESLKVAEGQYVALLDGDDFWVDELKLQKQVDFLDANKDYIVCGTDANVLIEENGLYEEHSMHHLEADSDFGFEDIAFKHRILTGSSLFRNHEILRSLPDWLKTAPVADWPLFLLLSQFGRAKNLDFIGLTYRKHGGGIYSNVTGFKKNNITVSLYNLYFREFEIKGSRVFDRYRKYVFWTFLDCTDKSKKKELLLNYLKPFELKLLVDRSFIKMVFNYLFR